MNLNTQYFYEVISYSVHNPTHHLRTMLRHNVFSINRGIRTHTYCQLPKVTEPELKFFLNFHNTLYILIV